MFENIIEFLRTNHMIVGNLFCLIGFFINIFMIFTIPINNWSRCRNFSILAFAGVLQCIGCVIVGNYPALVFSFAFTMFDVGYAMYSYLKD